MSNSTGFYPSVRVDSSGDGVVSQAGGLVLARVVHASGLGAGLTDALGPWRKPFARQDPAKILTDVALSLATGGDCVSDVDRLRSQPQVYGVVASDPTISRLIKTLSTVRTGKALAAVNAAMNPLIVDLDATLITSHSEKVDARPTWKKGYGFHPLPRSMTTAPKGPENHWPC